MGIWSRPLFVSVYPGKPDDYVIDIDKLSDMTFHDLHNNGFFNKIYDPKIKLLQRPRYYALSEFMNTQQHTHKILGHLHNRAIFIWLDLFKHILKKNTQLEEACFHFFCNDTHEPYYILLNRNIISEVSNTLYVYIGQSESRYYFIENRGSWFKRRRQDEWPFIFSLNLYMKNWEKAYFRNVRYQIKS